MVLYESHYEFNVLHTSSSEPPAAAGSVNKKFNDCIKTQFQKLKIHISLYHVCILFTIEHSIPSEAALGFTAISILSFISSNFPEESFPSI